MDVSAARPLISPPEVGKIVPLKGEGCLASKMVTYGAIALSILLVMGALIAIGRTGGFGHSGALRTKMVPWLHHSLEQKTPLFGLKLWQAAITMGAPICGGTGLGVLAVRPKI